MTLHEPIWDDARAAAYTAAGANEPVQSTLEHAIGLTLAEPIAAKSMVPAFDTAMMDGWAVAGDAPWTVRGRVLAGSMPPAISAGEALEIATGAPVPAGATAVLRREWGERIGEQLIATHAITSGLDIRTTGDEARIGDVLIDAGAVVTPPIVGLAALVGNDSLVVHRRPSVEALILGDEIVTAGIPPAGKVRDALGVQVLHWSNRYGAERRGVTHVPDTLDATVDALRNSTADLVFTTGGTAKGPVDHMHAALAAVGASLIVDEVKVRPGHPMLLAELPTGQFVIGLPGNPLAGVAGFLTFARPILLAMAKQPLPAMETVRTLGSISAPAGERRLIPATRTGATATPTEYWGSAMLRGIATSNCFLVSEPGGADVGDDVGVLELPW